MNKPLTNLSVWVENSSAYIRVRGRANCNASVDFKNLVVGLLDTGHKRFVLDLENCLIMDSTFLGVLAGLGQRFASGKTNGNGRPSIELYSPSERITDLLDNLGVTHMFILNAQPLLRHSETGETEIILKESSREEISQTCLDAHEVLMNLNPKNVPKFKDVTRFLKEDLKKVH